MPPVMTRKLPTEQREGSQVIGVLDGIRPCRRRALHRALDENLQDLIKTAYSKAPAKQFVHICVSGKYPFRVIKLQLGF